MTRRTKPDEVRVYASYGQFGFTYHRREIVGMPVYMAIYGLLSEDSPYRVYYTIAADFKNAFTVNRVPVEGTTLLKAGDVLILDCRDSPVSDLATSNKVAEKPVEDAIVTLNSGGDHAKRSLAERGSSFRGLWKLRRAD